MTAAGATAGYQCLVRSPELHSLPGFICWFIRLIIFEDAKSEIKSGIDHKCTDAVTRVGAFFVLYGHRRCRRRPEVPLETFASLIPPASPAPPIYEVMGDHGSPPAPLTVSQCHVNLRTLAIQQPRGYTTLGSCTVGRFSILEALIIRLLRHSHPPTPRWARVNT